MAKPTFEQEARDEWISSLDKLSDGQLKIGCLQRIGTALERIAAALEKQQEKPAVPTEALVKPPREWGRVSL